ncbi:hypothetical protein FJZ17_04445 [Candidatus Pacearchaeota archaeon]|nr:hypothetical protein [Candidatus Pacearchaeota archaeon]
MDEKELFALRHKGIQDFSSPRELRLFLQTLFGKDFVLPMVVGVRDFPPEPNWEVVPLEPLNTPDRLTVENYLEALKALEEENKKPRIYTGRVVFEGVESLHYSNWDTLLLNARVRKEADKETSFDLDIHFSSKEAEDSARKAIGYCAASKISESELQRVCSRFQGPNLDYRRLLI